MSKQENDRKKLPERDNSIGLQVISVFFLYSSFVHVYPDFIKNQIYIILMIEWETTLGTQRGQD